MSTEFLAFLLRNGCQAVLPSTAVVTEAAAAPTRRGSGTGVPAPSWRPALQALGEARGK